VSPGTCHAGVESTIGNSGKIVERHHAREGFITIPVGIIIEFILLAEPGLFC
jgi:hypothetical protein